MKLVGILGLSLILIALNGCSSPVNKSELISETSSVQVVKNSALGVAIEKKAPVEVIVNDTYTIEQEIK